MVSLREGEDEKERGKRDRVRVVSLKGRTGRWQGERKGSEGE